jgi:DNA processing protein
MLNKNFILHLTLIEGIGPHVIQKIIVLLRQGFEGQARSGVQTSDLYRLSASDWMSHFSISEINSHKLVAGLSDMTILEKELGLIEQNKIEWVTIADESYPALLKEIYLPPTVLYFQGSSFNELQPYPAHPECPEGVYRRIANKRIAVVGARKANEYGARAVQALVPDLVAAGYTIVSGGAIGIDAMAHEAALQCGGKTIAILGSGLLRLYPSSNKNLFKRIIESGGIVASSFPLLMEGFPHNFPARNRIVTGLSQGCVVVQAAKKSGALISAHCAMEQGREVFAVPGNFDDVLSAGCHEIIQQGAKLVMSSADIFAELGDKIALSAKKEVLEQQQKLFVSESNLISSARPELVEGSPRALEDILQQVQNERGKKGIANNDRYSESQQKIIAACKKPISLDEMSIKTELPFELIQSELFTLQIDGVLSQDFTGMWTLSK